ncbi:phosphopantetheine-binding protein [Streptomyces sp. Edi4]|uniref:phosphopantetheine-binding protein n=1 Tax=Streptomyces sp. Edi4 TaxID=3162527 RepID=UPI003305653F
MESKIALLRDWLGGLHEEPVSIQNDTDLVESGVVTSLQFVQMVIEIERLHGRKLDPGVITIESMRTLDAIDTAVFQAA